MAERSISMAERQATAKSLDLSLSHARSRRSAAWEFANNYRREHHGGLIMWEKTRRRALRHLRQIDLHPTATSEGFSESDETKLLRIRDRHHEEAQDRIESKGDYSAWARAGLASEITTNRRKIVVPLGLTHDEKVEALRTAGYEESSMPIDMWKKLGVSTVAGGGLFLAGEVIRVLSVAKDNALPFIVDKIPEAYLGTMAWTAAALYTLSYAIENYTNTRLTREFGKSANPAVTAMERAGKRLLSLPGRRTVSIAAVTGTDMAIHNVGFNGLVQSFTDDPRKVITASLMLIGLNLSVSAAGEGLLLANRIVKKKNAKTENQG